MDDQDSHVNFATLLTRNVVQGDDYDVSLDENNLNFLQYMYKGKNMEKISTVSRLEVEIF